jgi:hypothetical protein
VRMILKPQGHRVTLHGVPGPLTRALLVELLRRGDTDKKDAGSPSFDRELIAGRGEAWLRLYGGNTVLRFEKSLLAPKVSKQTQETFLSKLSQLPGKLPRQAIKPELPVYLDGSPDVVGHTLRYVRGLQTFEALAPQWSGEQATEALLALHAFIEECHSSEIIVGEVNPTNFGMVGGTFVAFDTLAYGIRGLPCVTVSRDTVDPKVLIPDETISDFSVRAIRRHKPYSVESDWYSFSSLVLMLLVGCAPYSGSHVDRMKQVQLRRDRVLALRGISVFDVRVSIDEDSLIRLPEMLSAPLYNHLYAVFNEGHRGTFPKALLSNLTWTTCSACGRDYAGMRCPCR